MGFDMQPLDPAGRLADSFVLTPSAQSAFDLVDSAIEDHRFFALALVGQAGMGKSATLSRILARARTEGHLAVSVDADLLREMDDLITKVGEALAVELPRVLVAAGYVANEFKPLSLLRDLVERRLSDSIASFLEILERIDKALPPDVAMLLALDGLNSGDLVNGRGFSNFVRRLADPGISRVKLLVTSQGPSIITHSLASMFTIVRLNPLTQEEVYRLFRLHFDVEKVTPEALDRIVIISQGNPLLLSLLAAYLPERVVGAGPLDLPTAIGATVEAVVSRYPPDAPNATRILQLIAVFNGEDVEFFQELSGMDEASFGRILSHLAPLILVSGVSPPVHSKKPIQLVHTAIREYLVSDLLKRTSLDRSTLQFGEEEAERDTRLPEQLVESTWLGPLLNGNKSIVLGDRGSGKSAIFRLFTEKIGSEQLGRPASNMIVVSDNNPAAFVQRLTTRDGGSSSAEKFKAIWLSLSAALVAKYFISDLAASANPDLLRQSALIVKAAGVSDRQAHPGGWRRRMLDRLKPLMQTKVSFKFGPIAIETADGSIGAWFTNSAIDVEDFLLRADGELATRGCTVRIVVDRIDEIYKYEVGLQESLVQGLFLAEARLSLLKRVAFVLLFRTDLFERYDIQEKNKFQSRTILLDWSEGDIATMLLRRVFSNKALHQLVSRLGISPERSGAHQEAALRLVFPEQMEGKAIRDWLAEYLTNGRGRIAPRQVILFLNAAKEETTRSAAQSAIPVFDTTSISEAMTRLSELCYDEVISDFRVATSLVRSCRAGRLSRFRLEEVSPLADTSEGSVSQQVELLERLGFIHRVVAPDEAGELRTWFEIPGLYTRCWLRTQDFS